MLLVTTFSLLLTLLPFISSSSSQCIDHFPLKESSDIMKELVEYHSDRRIVTDKDGTQWENTLFFENPRGYELDGVTYHLNSASLPPENTFYFDSLQFLSVPAFVVPASLHADWNPSYPDLTYSLSKISLDCGPDRRACGLQCCPTDNIRIQQLFADQTTNLAGQRVDLTEDSSVSFGGVKYGLKEAEPREDNSSCAYQISHYDVIVRKSLGDNSQLSTIYFRCPPSSSCCGLTCTPSPFMEHSRAARMNHDSHMTWPLSPSFRNIAWGMACALAFGVFVFISAYNYERSRSPPMPARIESRETRETQTSRLTLVEQPSLPLLTTSSTSSN